MAHGCTPKDFCYMYAVVGNLLFEKSAPGYFGNIGEGMLTLFQLLTLEGWNDILHDLRAASPVGLAYTVVFVLFGTYIVINLVVGVVITSLEDAYEHRLHGEARPDVARCVHDLQAAVDQAISDWRTLPADRVPVEALVPDVWSLRRAVRVNDAFYLAAARALGAPLLTADVRLARSGVRGVTISLLA